MVSQEALPPQKISVDGTRQILKLEWAGERYALTAEYLRVYSPSAEIHQHGHWRAVGGKAGIKIYSLRPVGQYALQIVFTDGHSSGLYTWAYLYDLAQNEALRWQHYLEALAVAGRSREKISPRAKLSKNDSAESA